MRFSTTPHNTLRVNVYLAGNNIDVTEFPWFELFQHTCVWGGFDFIERKQDETQLSWEFDSSLTKFFEKKFSSISHVEWDI